MSSSLPVTLNLEDSLDTDQVLQGQPGDLSSTLDGVNLGGTLNVSGRREPRFIETPSFLEDSLDTDQLVQRQPADLSSTLGGMGTLNMSDSSPTRTRQLSVTLPMPGVTEGSETESVEDVSELSLTQHWYVIHVTENHGDFFCKIFV